jgi:hypothetical protein
VNLLLHAVRSEPRVSSSVIGFSGLGNVSIENCEDGEEEHDAEQRLGRTSASSYLSTVRGRYLDWIEVKRKGAEKKCEELILVLVAMLLLKELQKSGRVSAINPPVHNPCNPGQHNANAQPHSVGTACAARVTHFDPLFPFRNQSFLNYYCHCHFWTELPAVPPRCTWKQKITNKLQHLNAWK